MVLLDVEREDFKDIRLNIGLSRAGTVIEMSRRFALVEHENFDRIKERSKYPVVARLVGLDMLEAGAPTSWFKTVDDLGD